MSRHRIAVALAAAASLAACERGARPPAPAEPLAALATEGPGLLRVTDSGMVVDHPPAGGAAGDGLRPAPGPAGLRP